jgi:phage terminase large subunit-like protein
MTAWTLPSPNSVRPRRITPRDPSRTTDGAAGAFVAHLHGRPWKPHQRAVADLIGEQTAAGGYAYPVCVILFPRQTGKTTFAFDLALGRALEQRDYRAAYTAQTGHVTTERFGERMAELAATPLGRRARIRRSQGTERIAFGNSYLKAFPPRDGALRGSALDLVIVDEPQEIDAELGVQLDQTILPTFTTRRRRQLILIGTAGTDQ